MTVAAELTSGKCTIYAQWCALLSVVFLVLFGVLNIFSVLPFSILAFAEAFFMIFLELPLVAACLPSFSFIAKFKEIFENILLRCGLYFGFAVLMWLSFIMSFTTLIIAAVFLTLTSGFYLIAFLKHEGLERSMFTGGSGILPNVESLA